MTTTFGNIYGSDTALTSAETGFPRIAPDVYDPLQILLATLGIVTASLRLLLKIYQHRRLDLDDYFLLAAVLLWAGSWSCAYYIRDLFYLEVELLTGMLLIDLDDLEDMRRFLQYFNASSVLTMASLFCVKLSFMFFFRKLIVRVTRLEAYWWAVVVLLIPSGIVCMCSGFFICSHFGPNYLEQCPLSTLIERQKIYIYVTVPIDIFTDLLVLSFPIIILWRIRITLWRKLLLGTALCLSTFMIIVTIIRVALCELPSGNLDAVWLCIWQATEVCTALMTVSITGFRSLYGQAAATRSAVSGTNNSDSCARYPSQTPVRDFGWNGRAYQALPELPRRAVTGLKGLLNRTHGHGDANKYAGTAMAELERADSSIALSPLDKSSADLDSQEDVHWERALQPEHQIIAFKTLPSLPRPEKV